jgi:hypothetical protein
VICHNCGVKGHYKLGCRQPKVICYGCGQPGHMKPSCPNKQKFAPPTGGNRPSIGMPASKGRNPGYNKGKPYGKPNCTSVAEVIHSEEAVLGTLNIMTYPRKVLFDTGITTSFISKEFIDTYGLKCKPLDQPTTIMSARGTILCSSWKDCTPTLPMHVVSSTSSCHIFIDNTSPFETSPLLVFFFLDHSHCFPSNAKLSSRTDIQ